MPLHSKYIVLFFAVFNLTGFGRTTPITVYDLRCENLIQPIAIDNDRPHFSWKIKYAEGQMKQRYYEVQVASDSLTLKRNRQPDLWNTGKTKSDESVMIPYSGKPLSSRSLAYWRVRVWNEKGETSAWSEIQRFGVGILTNDTIQGNYIGLPAVQSPLLRKSFSLNNVGTSFLHVNSLGYYEIFINGKKVGDDVLSPAVSHLDKRSLINTYDVTAYLRKGENEIVFWLGTGWFKTTTGFDVQFDGAVVKAQLDIYKNKQWQTALTTDSSWMGSPSGYKDTGTWRALQFGGERVDANLNPANMSKTTLNARNWEKVTVVDIPKHTASPQMVEANKIQETFIATDIKQLADSTWLIDMGKALNGWFEIRLNGLINRQQIVFEYSDFLDKEGNFLDQGQQDIYIAKGNGSEVFRNKFNHHAFQYVKISKLKQIPNKEDIKAHLIHTDFRSTSSFESSDADLNAIHDMIQYTMRTLSFSGYMVDCPHLERAGYGGDGNSSTNAFQTMFNASPLYSNWVQAWADVMREGGSLPHVAPNPGAGGGGPYWCSFLILSSWRTYVNYNDPRLIQRYYPMMKEWLSYVERYTVDGLLQRWPDTKYRDWFLGDWLAPHGVDSGNQSSIDLVNNGVISECFGIMEKIAKLLNKPTEANLYAEKKAVLNKLIHQSFFDQNDNSYATGSQLDMAYPMLLGITPPDKYEQVKNNLVKITNQRHNNHIAVGLVGVPILTQWAIENNEVNFMYGMLKKRDYPGYLYMIDNGASTTWEYWSGERSRIHNCYNGIGTWFYQAIGGIRVDEQNPGYRHIYISPQIPKGLTWANTTIDTPYGHVKVNWKLSANKLVIEVTIPVGSRSTIEAPENMALVKVNQKSVNNERTIVIEDGVHVLEMSAQ
ncbi:family 78 glycoside hydrolase catalytic domain [Sphingobacterium hungaricum]|uniref:alpha-L-rhamnosidase n=1 Tax=Sphingobacterium hungaricum TaxID=2082723 RepID=A0A928V1E5_9SPHI|nr:family 78 glycoside hydrolase catalytic domain [Sphingobacterium hungaricum]MBE8715340.1 alpha-rhamnosidase [Sphingobacterium hungaricum]